MKDDGLWYDDWCNGPDAGPDLLRLVGNDVWRLHCLDERLKTRTFSLAVDGKPGTKVTIDGKPGVVRVCDFASAYIEGRARP